MVGTEVGVLQATVEATVADRPTAAGGGVEIIASFLTFASRRIARYTTITFQAVMTADMLAASAEQRSARYTETSSLRVDKT